MKNTTKKILLIQPRHNYAPHYSENKIGHIYMPTSLLAAASIFLAIGVEVEFIDENIIQSDLNHNLVGINLLGSPYIPIALEIEKRLKLKYDNDFLLLIGGQIVSGLSQVDMYSLFSPQTINGNSYKNLSKYFNVKEETIPKVENLSFQDVYNLIDEKIFKLYLENEFGFYLSQGCKYSCSFCAAKRTIILSDLGIKNREVEVFRNIDLALADLEFLIKKAINFGIKKIQIYLSNLDLFQNPQNLFPFAEGVVKLTKKYHPLKIKMRGLSTSRSFIKAHIRYPYVIKEMVKAGLFQIGFGIDGATPKVYKETRKPQTVKESLDAVKISRESYNITPETLMVFGHNNKEDEKALELAVVFCKDMQEKYGASPRPHVAKDIIPGNDGWFNPSNRNILEQFYKNTFLFQNLDFTAVPSPITHPNPEFRSLVTKYYKMVCDLPNSLTQYVLAELPDMSESELKSVRLHNQGRYDI